MLLIKYTIKQSDLWNIILTHIVDCIPQFNILILFKNQTNNKFDSIKTKQAKYRELKIYRP